MICPGCGRHLSEPAEVRLGCCFACLGITAEERLELRRSSSRSGSRPGDAKDHITNEQKGVTDG